MTVAGPGVRALAGGLVALVLAVDPAAAQGPPYLDPTLPVERRIDDLLARMTLEEKVGQMLCLWQGKRAITDSQGRFDPSRPPRWFRIGIGRIELLDIPGRWGRVDAFGRGRVEVNHKPGLRPQLGAAQSGRGRRSAAAP